MKKVLSLLLTLAIIISLVPAHKVEAKSKMITMYVISEGSARYEYNKNGLVAKEIRGNSISATYKYKGSRLIEMEEYGHKTKISYNKKKRLVKIVYWWGEKDSFSQKYYYNKKGKITKCVHDDGSYTKYTYGKRKEEQTTYSKAGKATGGSKFYYDSHGYYKTVVNNPGENVNIVNCGRFTFKNKYNKKGCVIQRTEKTEMPSTFITGYTYKKIRVPASYKKAIIKQQKSIINKISPFEWSNTF